MAKRKANLNDIPHYYATLRSGVKNKNGMLTMGYYYYLCDRLDNDKKQELLDKHNNIMFFEVAVQYAPEIKHPVIFLADKKL